MYHFDLFEDMITILNLDRLSDKALNVLDEAINKCNLKRSNNTITGTEYDFL